MKLLILVFSLSLVMASIPDSVIRCGKEVSLSARALYTVYCSHHTGAGLAQVSDECAMDEAGISRSKFYEAVKELKGKGWIGEEKEGGIKLLKGREEFENAPSRFWTNRGIGPNSGLAPVENSPDFGQFSTGCMNKNAHARARAAHSHSHKHEISIVCECESVALFVQILDSVPPPKFQDAIRSRIEDLAQWEETLWFWRRKNYRVTNINGLLDNYDRHVSTKQRAYVGNGSSASAIAAPAAKEEEDPLEQLKELAREIECWCERENREPFEWEQELIDRAKAADRQPRPF